MPIIIKIMGSFTPLVFGTNGGKGNECQRFLKHLADKIAQKDTEPYHVASKVRGRRFVAR